MNEKVLNSRQTCYIVKGLCENAEVIKAALELSASDSVLKSCEKGLNEYEKLLNEYLEQYTNAKGSLIEFLNKEVLLGCIMEQEISDRSILINLALKAGVANQWSGFPRI